MSSLCLQTLPLHDDQNILPLADASLVNCCIIMVFETVESIDIPPPRIRPVVLTVIPWIRPVVLAVIPQIRPVVLAVIPLPPATITDETPFPSRYQAITIDL